MNYFRYSGEVWGVKNTPGCDARDGEGHTHWHACGEGKIHPPHPVSPGRTGWGNCAGRIKLVQTQCCFSQGGRVRCRDSLPIFSSVHRCRQDEGG